MRSDDLVAEAVVEEAEDLLLRRARETEQILDRVHIERIPLQLEAHWFRSGTSAREEGGLLQPLTFGLLEHPWVEQIIDLLVVDLQERDVHLYVLELSERLDLLNQLVNTSLYQSVLHPIPGALVVCHRKEDASVGFPVLVAVHRVRLA